MSLELYGGGKTSIICLKLKFNKGLKEIFGYPGGDLLGFQVSKRHPDALLAKTRCSLSCVLSYHQKKADTLFYMVVLYGSFLMQV